ncbi:hypothetical protein DL96DRAFT_1782564 [Flagelloscypha sp. PMI_526]|nr:hypothetical protein DL96DRAFT_1782564 [Flagelloscypha sp. PMI_526]
MVLTGTHVLGSFTTLPLEIWSEICLVLLASDYGTGRNARSLSLTCRAFYDIVRHERWKTVALLDFDRILKFTRLLVSTPLDSEIRKIENLFILFSEDWSGELEYGEDWIEEIDPSKESPELEDWETSSLTSDEHAEIKEDVEWFSTQPETEQTSLVPVDENLSNERQIYFIGNNCILGGRFWFLDLVHYILSSCSATLKHLHWHTATSNALGAGISLPSRLPLPNLEVLVTSRSSSSKVFDTYWRRGGNELSDHLLWMELHLPLVNPYGNEGFDEEKCMQLDLPALRILHIGLPVGPRPPPDIVPQRFPIRLTQFWFDRFREAVFDGCPSLETFGLTPLDGTTNEPNWCQRAALDLNRLWEMYSKVMRPIPEESLETDDEEDRFIEHPTPHEIFEIWKRCLGGEELAPFPIIPEVYPELFPP